MRAFFRMKIFLLHTHLDLKNFFKQRVCGHVGKVLFADILDTFYIDNIDFGNVCVRGAIRLMRKIRPSVCVYFYFFLFIIHLMKKNKFRKSRLFFA